VEIRGYHICYDGQQQQFHVTACGETRRCRISIPPFSGHIVRLSPTPGNSRHAKSHTPTSATALGPCAPRTVLQSTAQKLCHGLEHTAVGQHQLHLNSSQLHGPDMHADRTMSLSLVVGTQAAKPPQQQHDPAHEQLSSRPRPTTSACAHVTLLLAASAKAQCFAR
jgi:hypothetical protein